MIIPGILENNFSGVCSELDRFADICKRVQIDLASWKPKGDEDLPHWDVYDFEFDLLRNSNMEMLEICKDLGAAYVVIHISNSNEGLLSEMYNYCKNYDMRMALCGPVDHVIKNIEHCDSVQLMGIENVGAQGQPFRPSVVDDIKKLKLVTDKIIQIDGAMNEDTIKMCRDAGATQFVVGSVLKKSLDIVSTYRKLQNIVHS